MDQSPKPARGPKPVVLIVEDEPIIAFGLEMDLEAAGFMTAGPFASCADALAWLKTETPSVAVLDSELTDGSCREVAAELKQRRVPFVMFSATRRSDALSDFDGCLGWIEKPNPSEMVINLLLEDRVRRRAFELWEQYGRPEGRDAEIWLQAERELNGVNRGDIPAAPAERFLVTEVSKPPDKPNSRQWPVSGGRTWLSRPSRRSQSATKS